MKKTLALILALVMLISISTTAIYAEDFAISDELLEAVRVDYAGLDNIEKSDIHLYYNLHINGDKYLVRLEVSGCAYPDDVVKQTIGHYRLYAPSRPLPQIFTNGQLYEIKYAYENGIIDDSDLAVISTFDELQFDSKLSAQLQELVENSSLDKKICIDISTEGYHPNATAMPSWPNKSAARVELKQFYSNWYNTEMVPVVFDGIEYEEVFVGSGIVIVSVKASDIKKIASCGIVRSVSYFDNTGYEVNQEEDIYKDRLLKQYELEDVEKAGELTYTELGQIDVDADDGMDYAVIYSRIAIGSDAMTYLDLGTRYIENPQICYPFYYCYALYDIENDKFIPIEYTLNGDYPFIQECIEKYEIGIPFGDADSDGELSVLDATEIQLVEAKKRVTRLDLGSDINRDKSVDILDATAIQYEIAQK